MKLAQQLRATGALAPHHTRHCGDWQYLPHRAPNLLLADPLSHALHRRSNALKVTPRGWKALLHVLRLP